LFIVWIVFHVIVCISLILVVLLQASKGGGLAGSAFGGSDLGGAVFGGRGAASFLSKATSVLAILFMFNSVGLAYMSAQRRTVTAEESESIVTQRAREELNQQMQVEQQRVADSVAQAQQGSALDTLGGFDETPAVDSPGN
jgi:preprotein translocase subunit SecG